MDVLEVVEAILKNESFSMQDNRDVRRLAEILKALEKCFVLPSSLWCVVLTGVLDAPTFWRQKWSRQSRVRPTERPRDQQALFKGL